MKNSTERGDFLRFYAYICHAIDGFAHGGSKGKDIIYTEWKDDVKIKEKTLKWNGRRFSF